MNLTVTIIITCAGLGFVEEVFLCAFKAQSSPEIFCVGRKVPVISVVLGSGKGMYVCVCVVFIHKQK